MNDGNLGPLIDFVINYSGKCPLTIAIHLIALISLLPPQLILQLLHSPRVSSSSDLTAILFGRPQIIHL